MFLKSRVRRLESAVKDLERLIDSARDRHWALSQKHDRLMSYLDLQEHERKGIEIRKIDKGLLGK